MRNLDRAGFSRSLERSQERWSGPNRLLVASVANCRRAMAAINEHNLSRDRVWPRNYSCWIRAPEATGRSESWQQEGDEQGGMHMKTIARLWEEQFEDLMHDGPRGQFRQRLEWFLFRLHLAVHTVETQSDGSKLFIFRDGSVYGEESELDSLLTLASRRPRRDQAQFGRARNDQNRCRKANGYVQHRG